ncbi:cytidine deaminase 1 [Arachis duranensis]|uniref:cytidine deaminase n=1 Tax=Arachis duranensis TaxID=130453 RepID=A0A6P4DFT2_ARADU|nr:cytidine deaminase 1 [Arachis duranensis]
MDQPRFVISATEAQLLAQSSGLPSVNEVLPTLVPTAQSLARPPISKFPVAAVGVGKSGRIFIGVNLEFPGLPFHHTIHAEQFLVANLLLNSEPSLVSFAVSAAPCGHCRQFLQELPNATDLKIVITNQRNPNFSPLSQFLNHRFGPRDLLPDSVPLLLEPHNHGLSLPNKFNSNDFDLKLVFAALEAANASHAPYSASPSGAAVMDCEGKVYRGSYIESAAYNPSLGPLQAAIVAYVAGGGGDYERIVAAVLVEKDGAVVKQEHTARLLLRAISPKCDFKALICSPKNED